MRNVNTNWIKAKPDQPRKWLGLAEFRKGSCGKWELLSQCSSHSFKGTSRLAVKARWQAFIHMQVHLIFKRAQQGGTSPLIFRSEKWPREVWAAQSHIGSIRAGHLLSPSSSCFLHTHWGVLLNSGLYPVPACSQVLFHGVLFQAETAPGLKPCT